MVITELLIFVAPFNNVSDNKIKLRCHCTTANASNNFAPLFTYSLLRGLGSLLFIYLLTHMQMAWRFCFFSIAETGLKLYFFSRPFGRKSRNCFSIPGGGACRSHFTGGLPACLPASSPLLSTLLPACSLTQSLMAVVCVLWLAVLTHLFPGCGVTCFLAVAVAWLFFSVFGYRCSVSCSGCRV